MDIYCTNCGEPWDALDPDRKKIIAGKCDVCFGRPEKRNTSLRTQAAAAMADVLGDDIDGMAAMMEDFEYLGMLED